MELKTINGYTFTMDEEDFAKVIGYRFTGKTDSYKLSDGSTRIRSVYIYLTKRENVITKRIRLHRYLLNAPQGVEVDHIDGNGLNNHRSNLRLCTHHQNCCSQQKGTRNKSGFKGVSKKGKNRWQASIKVNYKSKHIGYFNSPEEAARAYNVFARQVFGEFAVLNSI